MAKIPAVLKEPIATAFPMHVCLVASVLPDGYAQVSPRGSVMVYDDDNLAIWERGHGSTTANMNDGTKLTVYFQDFALAQSGVLPKAGVARFYGPAEVHRSGPVYDKVWEKLIEPEKGRDPDKKGYAVLIKVERVEDLSGDPIPA
ncbi:MAG: pyridoxamine 5'-phosphate oxidase family protein [Caulobacteraceae bacterium]